MAARIVAMRLPSYPAGAHSSGTVVLSAVIGADGSVKSVAPLSGPADLRGAATDSVREWRYDPVALDGEFVEVTTTISVAFAPGQPVRYLQQGMAVPQTGAAADPQLRGDILHLIQVMRLKEAQADFGRDLMDSLRPSILASLPPGADGEKILRDMRDRLVAALQSDEAMDRIIAVYARYLSDEDVRGIAAFYETPAGQRLNSVSVRMEDDLSQTGREFALENMPAILKALCQRRPELRGGGDFCPVGASEKKSLRLSPAPPQGAPPRKVFGN